MASPGTVLPMHDMHVHDEEIMKSTNERHDWVHVCKDITLHVLKVHNQHVAAYNRQHTDTTTRVKRNAQCHSTAMRR
jgi:hypothetical protein